MTPTSAISVVACSSAPSFPWTTLLGTFVGAALAFGANLIIQSLQRKKIKIAAGNMAIAILSKQFGDYIIFRSGLLNELSDRAAFPKWLQIKPTTFRFSESLKFDMSALTFLAEHGQPEILKILLIAETKYRDLLMLIEKNSDACEIRDTQLIKKMPAPIFVSDMELIENSFDQMQKAMLTHFNNLLQQHAIEDINTYLNAGERLVAHMRGFTKASAVMPFGPIGAREGLEKLEWPKQFLDPDPVSPTFSTDTEISS